MMYAQVIIAISSRQLDRAFDYSIPASLAQQVTIGSRVVAPFGPSKKEGFVVGLSDTCELPREKIKAILTVRNGGPVFDEERLALARFMRERYRATLYDCIRCMTPRGIECRDNLAKKQKFASLNYDNDLLEDLLEEIPQNSAQERIVEFLREHESAAVSDIKLLLRVSASPIQTLVKKEIITVEEVELLRDTVDYSASEPAARPELTLQQAGALTSIELAYPRTVLLHGATGSGKTEVYMRLIESAVSQGRTAIMLVPEIALTPQTVAVFTNRFGPLVSVTHSRLSLGERYDQWKKARDGIISIMIGARSALFTPFKNLGVIIIDEEHEKTYQSETTPKYTAKEVAEERARLAGAQLVLGSATPGVTTYYEARQGRLALVKMPERVNKTAPRIFVADMRAELAGGNMSVFSGALRAALEQTLRQGRQSILFLNRRGHSTFVSCRQCGAVMTCENCNVNYTYHLQTNQLMCHYCGKKVKNPTNCPVCGSRHIKYFGLGTQRLETEFKKLFPTAKALRMDMDTTSGKSSHERILSAFRNAEADTLIGTQMIAKGLDFPNVSLVGIVAADLSLNTGDFRAGETTFQLLTQVAGRAGRAALAGDVYIQTYNPEHYSIKFARQNNYEEFYEHEIILRRQMMYPPFCDIFCVLFIGESEKNIIILLTKLLEIMKSYNRKGLFEMIGPAPAVVSKVKNRYRWKLIIKSQDGEKLKNFTHYCVDKLKESENVENITINLTFNPALII
ncbi:MAG: primosomal protein N' [Clostridiales bacterium]|jgi:primosomal protein N' (replication factor Y)|nr:primosomal protein N' [Clostridiales bacterium]